MIVWIATTFSTVLISIIISYFFSSPIKNLMAPLVVKFRRRGNSDITGVWETVFAYDNEQHDEVIEIYKFLGTYYGRIIPKDLDEKKVLRVRGEVSDNRYFTGIWYHPKEKSRYHGAFQLIIEGDMEEMNGKWVGFSKSQNVVKTNDWTWKKVDEFDL